MNAMQFELKDNLTNNEFKTAYCDIHVHIFEYDLSF